MIKLGLERMQPLLAALEQPHKTFDVFHVAGTNGKGSVCAYLSSILRCSSIQVGRFTSPHLLTPADSIAVNDRPILSGLFSDAQNLVTNAARRNHIPATEFEVLTATAMEVFSRRGIDVAVIETGVGGRHDATNVDYLAGGVLGTIITRVGLDHTDLLGPTLQDIARHKAGIVRPKAPCVVSGENDEEVIRVVEDVAKNLRVVRPTEILQLEDGAYFDTTAYGPVRLSDTPLNGEYQHMNLACALAALDLASHRLPTVTPVTIKHGISTVQWPGRLQFVDFEGRRILLDGAHNVQAATALSRFVDSTVRQSQQRVTWIMALSGNRDAREILQLLVQPGDKFYALGFGPVDSMPWVKPQDPAILRAVAQSLQAEVGREESLDTILHKVDGPVIACGSLYLISDILNHIGLNRV